MDCTIPSEVTLLVPHDAAKTLFTTTPTALTPGKQAATIKNEFKSLTLAEGVTLTVEGGLSVGGQYQSPPAAATVICPVITARSG